MTCEGIREHLVETARGRNLSSDLRAIVFEHAAQCRSCAAELDAHRRLTGALSDLATEADAAPARLEQAIRRQLHVVPIRTKPVRRDVLPRVAAWAGIAAALVLGAFVVASHRTHQAAPPQEPAVVASAVSHEQAPQAAPVLKAGLDTDSDDDFTPLPYAEALAPDESTEILRVEMPREALLTMGMPVSGDRLNDQVLADVMVGADGTPRAIRLYN